jgi:hypothetical protein
MYHLVIVEIQKRIEELEQIRNRLSDSQKYCLDAIKERLPRQLNKFEVDLREFAAINSLMIEGKLWKDPPASKSANEPTVFDEKYKFEGRR